MCASSSFNLIMEWNYRLWKGLFAMLRDDIYLSSTGGLWNFTREVRENQACVMKSTVINTSKEVMSYRY